MKHDLVSVPRNSHYVLCGLEQAVRLVWALTWEPEKQEMEAAEGG